MDTNDIYRPSRRGQETSERETFHHDPYQALTKTQKNIPHSSRIAREGDGRPQNGMEQLTRTLEYAGKVWYAEKAYLKHQEKVLAI